MATLAYCLKKMGKGFDPGIAKHLRDLTEDYKDMDMAKNEAEVQAVQDVLDMLDREHSSVVDQLNDHMKKEILRIETTPGRWFNFEFARNNLPKIQARITQLQKMFWDSDTFAKGDIYDGSYPIPTAGGIITARRTKKYAKDPKYKSKVEGAIQAISENLVGANHTQMILLGKADPGGQYGVKYAVEKVGEGIKAGYGVNVERAWFNEAKDNYPVMPHQLGDISVREGLQNSLDAVLEAIENGQIKKGQIDISIYNKAEMDIEGEGGDYPVRNRIIDPAKLYGIAYEAFYPSHNSYQIVDNGIGMSDIDIKDKFLALHSTGKDKMGRFGGFGVAKAVILGPARRATWVLETNEWYHDGVAAQEAAATTKVKEPRKGTLIRVETPSNISTFDSIRYVETTELPSNVGVKFNGKKPKNPFKNKKNKSFSHAVNPGKNESKLDIKYYPKSPKGYDKKLILRLVDEKTGAKLTQGITNIYNNGFAGTMVVDITTTQTPGGTYYPLDDSRITLKYDGRQEIDKIIGEYAVDPLSAARATIDSKWYDLKDRSEWKKTIEKTKTDKGYNKLVGVITEIWNESQEKDLTIEKEVVGIKLQTGQPFMAQTIPYTPIDQLKQKVDVGFKGYRGGSMFMAKHILAYEAVARMVAAAAGGNVDKFYPFLSMKVDGGWVGAEYGALNGSMGMNPLSIDKDSTKSPLHYALYLKGLIDHEFTHAYQGAHDERFAAARESTHRRTAHLFPQTLRIAEAALEMSDKELTRDNVVEKEVLKEVIKEVEVSTETIITEYKPLPMRQGQLFDAQTLINEPTGDTPNDIKLYYPSRAKGLPRQLRLFDQRVDGRSPGRISPTEREGSGGRDQLPLPQEIVKIGKRDGAFDGVDLTRAEAEVAKAAKKLPGYYRMPDDRIIRVMQSKFHDDKWTFYTVSQEAFSAGKKGNRSKIKEKTLFDTQGEALTALSEYAVSRNYVPVKPAFGGGFTEITMEAIEARADALRTITKGIEYEYWGIPKDSKAGKFLNGDVDLADLSPKSFTVNELRGLARLLGTPETGTKEEIYGGALKGVELYEAIDAYTLEENPVALIADNFTKAQLRDFAIALDATPVGNKATLAKNVWRNYTQLWHYTVKNYIQFFEDVKKPVPKNIQEVWLEVQDAYRKAWGDTVEIAPPKTVSTIDAKDLVSKIDSPTLVKAIQSVDSRSQSRDLGTQLGILGAEYPSIKKALRKASDKLKLKQAQAAAETDTDAQLSYLEIERVLSMANDFVAAFNGEKNSMSKVASDYTNDMPVKNESIIRQAFYGETPVRIQGPIEQYMATRQAKEMYRKHYMKDQGITLDDVKRLFKGTNVFQREDGTITVTTPTGHSLIIESMDSVDVNNAHFEAKIGRPLKKGETAIGKYYKGRIELHKDLADNWTLTHETVHWLEDVGYIKPEESDILRDHIQELHAKKQWKPKNLKDVGGTEDRANFIAWSINNRAKNTSVIDKIIQKIKDLIDGFVGLFKLTPQSIVRDLETGKVFEREKEENFGQIFLDPMFRTKELYTTATPQDQEFMREHNNNTAAEDVSRSLREHTMTLWGRVGRWMHRMREIGIGENQDTTAWERLLFTPIHYFSKVPAAGAMVEDGTQRSDNYYKGLNWIEKDSNGKSRIQIGRKLQKVNKKEYRRINKYLDDNDMNKYGFTVRLAPKTEESTGKVFNVKDPDGKIVATATNYDDGWAEAIRLEVASLAEQGYSDLAQDWVQATREMTNNVFNIMRGAINDLISRYNAKGLSLPKVATMVDGQRVEVDLKVALAKMGDMRGHYMPRIRKPGNWSMYAKPRKGFEDRLHPILRHFETKSFAAAEASKKMYDNYAVDIVPLNKMPEDVFQIAGQVIAFQELMNQALDQVSDNMKKGVAVDMMKALDRAQLEMGKQLVEGVANVFKGRGVRSHMIMRNDAVGAQVWKGYEEDSIQRMAKYIRGIAAGEAKKKMMLDMLRHMTGTDISWSEFKAEHAKAGLETNYPEYLTFVKNRRIDPIKQRNAFHDALTYMEDMGRNDEGVDRFIGTVKGLAVLKYLAGRVSAPIVNLTALATSVPASMRGFAKIPMRKTPRLLADAMKGWREYRRALKNGNEADIPEWKRQMYEEIEDRGWHTAQYNKEALSVLKSKIGNQYDNTIEWLMLGFGATEMVNRMSTIAGTYIGQREMNQKEWDAAGEAERKNLHKDWMRTAKETSDKAHGVYSKANRPHYARGANPMARLAQMFYVFKTFSHNYLQTMYDLGFKTKDRTALLYMALAPAIIGGATASPLIKIMMEAFGLLPGAPEEPEEALYEWFENNFGEPVEQIVRLGAFGMGGYGVSLKGSLEIGVTDIPTSLKDLAGAPGSLVSDVVVGGKSILRGDWSKGLERMSPNFIGSGIKAWREATTGVTTSSNAPLFYGRDPVKLDWFEAFYRSLSFNPARIAKIRERQWKERSVDRKMSELRYDIYARIKAYYSKPKSRRSKKRYLGILEEIRTYNALVKRMGKPFPVITHRSIKNNLRRAFRPSKYERLRGTY